MDLLYFTAGIAALVAAALLIIKRIESSSYLHRRIKAADTEPEAIPSRKLTAAERRDLAYLEWFTKQQARKA